MVTRKGLQAVGLFGIVLALLAAVPGAFDYIQQVKNKPFIDVREYQWVRINGSGVSADLSTAGLKTLTFTRAPLGVAGTNTNHYIRIYDGVGTPEVVLITGGTCAPGGLNCTLTVTTTQVHTGAWKVGTATAGIQETLNSCVTSCNVKITENAILYAPVTIPQGTVPLAGYRISGEGRYTTKLTIASSFPLSALGVFIVGFDGTPALQLFGPAIEDIGIVFPQPWGQPRSAFTHWPPMFYGLGISGVALRRLYVAGAWDGVLLDLYPHDSMNPTVVGGQHIIDDVQMSAFNVGLDIRGMGDIVRVSKFHFWPFTEEPVPTFGAQQTFYDQNVVGLRAEHLSGLFISDSFFISGTSIDLVGSISLVSITNTSFDVFASIRMGFGGGSNVSINNAFFYQNNVVGDYSCTAPVISIGSASAQLTVTGSTFYKSCTTQPLVSIVAPAASNPSYAQVSFRGNKIYELSGDVNTSSVFALSGSTAPLWVDISGNQIAYQGDVSYLNPMLSLTGTGIQLNFQGNTNTGTGGGVWLNIASDGHHVVANNQFAQNWAAVLPSSRLTGVYQDHQFSYSHQTPITVKTTGVYTLSGAAETVLCDGVGGAIQLNLPNAAVVPGTVIALKKIDASGNQCFFQPTGGELIDGAATKGTVTQYEVIRVASDGVSGWHIL
jgi:hypothetical protein